MISGPFFFASGHRHRRRVFRLAGAGDLTPVLTSPEQLFIGYGLAVSSVFPPASSSERAGR